MTCMGCEVPVLHETIVGMLRIDSCNQQWLNRYEKKLCELFSSTNRKYKLCTGIDCDNCIKINQPNLESVMCNCGKIFCFRCKSDDHSPCTCEQKEKWMQFVMKEEADAKWIAMNAKLCPWCKKAVERSAGCNYMACVCGKSFCYLCSKPWEPDHKDHFKCHIYVKKPDEAVNREKEVLERINHSTERYLSNQSTAESYRKTDLFSKRKLLFRVLGISLSESEFIENAFKYAI